LARPSTIGNWTENALIPSTVSGKPATQNLTDDQVRQILIRDSLAKYPGNCLCPYNTDRAGRKCGKRSAYSKPGGYAPLCYSQDVTDEMVERYRSSN